MSVKAQRFLASKGIAYGDVVSIVRQDGKTVVRTIDGCEVSTFVPLRQIVEDFPVGVLDVVNKGVALACAHIDRVEGRVYVLDDGRRFTGRANETSLVRQVRSGVLPASREEAREMVGGSAAACDEPLLEDMPLLFFAVDVRFAAEGALAFTLGFANASARERLDVRPDAVGEPFFKAARKADKAWAGAIADTALNGGTRRVAWDGGPAEVLVCYAPQQGVCACIAVPSGAAVQSA